MKSDHTCEFLCATCGLLVAGPLVPLGDESLLCREDGRDYLPTGYFAISDGEYYTGTEGQVLLNLTDLRNTKRHPDPHRLNGCCGLDGCNGSNRVCMNGHEIGTERSDCWLAHAIHIKPTQVVQRDV